MNRFVATILNTITITVKSTNVLIGNVKIQYECEHGEWWFTYPIVIATPAGTLEDLKRRITLILQQIAITTRPDLPPEERRRSPVRFLDPLDPHDSKKIAQAWTCITAHDCVSILGRVMTDAERAALNDAKPRGTGVCVTAELDELLKTALKPEQLTVVCGGKVSDALSFKFRDRDVCPFQIVIENADDRPPGSLTRVTTMLLLASQNDLKNMKVRPEIPFEASGDIMRYLTAARLLLCDAGFAACIRALCSIWFYSAFGTTDDTIYDECVKEFDRLTEEYENARNANHKES